MPGIRSEADSGADARLVVIPDRGHYPFIEQPDASRRRS